MTTNWMRVLYLGVFIVTGAAFAAQVDVTCTGKTSDTSALNTAIASSNAGD